MHWNNIFNINKKCTHPRLSPEEDIGYCPDCGELIENHWYIVRCSCCGVKEPATIKNGEVIPEKNFCHNCGSKDYTVERIEKIDCTNINYAVLIQETIKNEISEYTQSWADAMQTSGYIPKQLQQFR